MALKPARCKHKHSPTQQCARLLAQQAGPRGVSREAWHGNHKWMAMKRMHCGVSACSAQKKAAICATTAASRSSAAAGAALALLLLGGDGGGGGEGAPTLAAAGTLSMYAWQTCREGGGREQDMVTTAGQQNGRCATVHNDTLPSPPASHEHMKGNSPAGWVRHTANPAPSGRTWTRQGSQWA